jgi:hypothetical protein
VTDLLSGILIAEYAAIALFFAKFWAKSRDRSQETLSGRAAARKEAHSAVSCPVVPLNDSFTSGGPRWGPRSDGRCASS